MTFLAFGLMEAKGLFIYSKKKYLDLIVTTMLGQTQLCHKWLLRQLKIAQDIGLLILNISALHNDWHPHQSVSMVESLSHLQLFLPQINLSSGYILLGGGGNCRKWGLVGEHRILWHCGYSSSLSSLDFPQPQASLLITCSCNDVLVPKMSKTTGLSDHEGKALKS